MASRRWYRHKYLWLLLLMIAAVSGFGTWRLYTVKADKPSYLLGTVERGDIVTQVAATGTLAAVTTVAVGTQVSGTIAELDADYNSEVKKGQLLAKLDQDLFRTQVEQAEASVRSAEATVNDDVASIANSKANLEKARVDLIDKQRKFKRQKELFDEQLIAQDDLDTAQAAMDAAVASLAAAQAGIDSAQAHLKADQARLVQAQASLQTAQVNLDHTIITSPISGTIISRNVDRGQTVAASFSSPTLFTIGEDLTKMQVNTNIDEADVGKIKAGMDATFTVDAYPGATFHGTISQVRLAAATVQNVVTYNALIDVPNPQLKLKPGMTANVKILIEKAENVLELPNAALRFKPSLTDQEMADAFKRAGEERYWEFYKRMNSGHTQGDSQVAGRPMAMGFNGAPNRNNSANAAATAGTVGNANAGDAGHGRRVAVWVVGEDKLPRPVVVRLGLTDGVHTEVQDGKLQEKEQIIIGLEGGNSRTTPSTAGRPPGFGGPGMGRMVR